MVRCSTCACGCSWILILLLIWILLEIIVIVVLLLLLLLLSLELLRTSRWKSSLCIATTILLCRLKLFVSLVLPSTTSSERVWCHLIEYSILEEARFLLRGCLLLAAFGLLANLVEKEILHLKEPVTLLLASDQMRHPFQDFVVLSLTTTSQCEISELEPRKELLLTVDPPSLIRLA